MTDRTVTAKMRADYSEYTSPTRVATQTTNGLVVAQKEAAAAAKAGAEANSGFSSASVEAARTTRLLTNAQREAAEAAKAAAVADTEATRALSAAQKEAALAAKDTSALGAERRAAAQQSVAAAEREAIAAAEAKNASAQQAAAAKAAVLAHRDEVASARESAIEETAAAKTSEAASKTRSEAYASTGKKMMVAGAVLAAGFLAAEKATMSFDKSLSGVQAVSQASAAEMGKLRAAALQAGADTAFSATQAADAEAELVKAGVSVADTLNGGLKGALSLAAAGQLDLADAAIISANAMNTFGLKGTDVAHIADVYAAAANKSAADVKELGYAMQQGGLVASQTGLTFEDTTAVLAAFSDRALKGADGGTSLKTMLEKLNAPSKEAAGLMDSLGIETYNASGKFVGITTLAGELHDKLGPLTDAQRNQALATIFGSDAIRGATILYSLGAQGMQGYKDAVNDSGAASRMAAAQMNNLSGDLEQLKGSLETALIQGGSGGTSALRGLTQEATKAVNAFSAMPKWLQEASVGFAGGSGGALLMVGALSTVVGKAGAASKAMKAAAEAGTGLKSGLAGVGGFLAGPWGIAIAGATTAISLLATRHHEAKIEVSSFADAIKQDGDALGAATTAAVANDPAIKALYGSFAKLGVSSKTVADAVLGDKDAMDQLTTATESGIKAVQGHGAASDVQRAALTGALKVAQSYRSGLVEQLKGTQQATAATQESTAATGASELSTKKAAEAAKAAAAAIFAHAAGQRAMADAEAAGGAVIEATTAKKKLAKGATSDLVAAVRKQAESNTDSTRTEGAAAAAADKHTDSLFKIASSARAAADAAAKNKSNTADEAEATAKSAEAAAEAAQTHQIGAKWLRDVADAEATAADSARTLDSSVTEEVAAMKDAKEKATGLKDALDALNGVHIAASRAAIDVQDKIAKLTGTLHENGTTLDITTEKGRANMSAIDDMAQAALAHAQAVADESGSIEAGNKALDASRAAFDKVLKSAGFSKDEIDRFNDSILKTPKLTEVKLNVTADTAAAAAALQRLYDKYAGTGISFGGGSSGKRIVSAYATGGLVGGTGTGTSDSNLIAASKGEYMVREEVVRRPGVLAGLNALNFGTGSATVVKPQVPLYNFGGSSDSSHPLVQAIERALSARPASGGSGPLAVFNYSGTQAPTAEQQAIMMRSLAQAVTG